MKKIITISYIVIISILLFWCNKEQDNNVNPINVLPTSCVDQDEWIPVITSISAYTGTTETKLEISGCNFSGFEWDKNAWIENEQWIKAILYGEKWSTSKILKISLKPSLCQNDNSYSGLPCENLLYLNPWKYKIYVMPWGKISNKVDFTVEKIEDNLTYQNVINYIDINITEIINDFSEKKPVNGKWFVDWYGFTSTSDVYVDFEDGHFLYRALLKCNNAQNTISCSALAIFEKNKNWIVVEWEDKVKDNPIIYKWAKDYDWER